jgi:hypothetical protein
MVSSNTQLKVAHTNPNKNALFFNIVNLATTSIQQQLIIDRKINAGVVQRLAGSFLKMFALHDLHERFVEMSMTVHDIEVYKVARHGMDEIVHDHSMQGTSTLGVNIVTDEHTVGNVKVRES